MQPPNRLGSVLQYFSSAYRFAFDKAEPSQAKGGSRLVMAMLQGLSTGYGRGTPDLDTIAAVRLAITSAWFYSGVRLIADRVASFDARPTVKKRAGEQLRDVKNHPFERLIERPNSLMTADFIWRYTTFWAYLLGNAYIFISTPAPGVGVPEELWPLPANMVRPLPDTMRLSRLTGKPCIDYEYIINGKPYRLPGENVLHIRFANPFDYWTGLSPLTAMIHAIKVDRYQARYLEGFFGKDNAIPTAIISLPPETNDIDFEVAKEQIREQFGEGRRSAITRAGDLKVETISQTINEMNINESRKFSRSEIWGCIGVPEGLISGQEADRLATEITFARNAIQPFLDLIAAQMTLDIAPYYGDDLVFKAPSIIPQDRSLAINEFTSYANDRTINENREKLGLPPIVVPDGRPELSWISDWSSFIPVRLYPFVSSNTFMAGSPADAYNPDNPDAMTIDGAPPAFANVEQAPEVGDLPGQTGDIHEMQVQGEGYKAAPPTRDMLEASRIGQREELKRWRAIAIKEAKEGRDPAERLFTTGALPEPIVTSINATLHKATEDSVKFIFETYLKTLE